MKNDSKFENEPDKQIFLFEKGGSITLPINEDDFKKFITGLLGRPQTIEALIENEFELNHHGVEHIYSAIEQRITQQNGGHLISFNARIIFSDKSSVLVNSLPELLTFNQIKPVMCEALHLTFQYLIKFNDKDVPEKQEINISFTTGNKIPDRLRKIYLNPMIRLLIDTGVNDRAGNIQYTIKHTARTWGVDIEALLSNLLNGITKKENSFLLFFRNYLGILSFAIWLLTLLSMLYLDYKIDLNQIDIQLNEVNKIFQAQSESFGSIDDKLRFISQKLNGKPVDPFRFLVIFAGMFGGLFISSILSSLVTHNQKSSYILLSEESRKFKDSNEKKYQRRWIIFFVSLVLSIVCNLLSSYIYDAFIK